MIASSGTQCLRTERSLNDDNSSCISPESSIHPSDYDSEDSSTDEYYGRECCTIPTSSPTFPSATTNKQGSHTIEIMNTETSSSSSSGDGWKTEGSSASYLSSKGDNGSEYDEARISLQSRQKMRKSDEYQVVGTNFARPIDVEQLLHTHASSLSRQLVVLRCVDDLSQVNSPSIGHHIVGIAQSGRKALVQGNHSSMRAIHLVRQELPLSHLREDGMRPASPYRDLVHVAMQRRGNDIEKGNARDTNAQPGKKCESRRSGFEMFLILVISASLVTLVVLLALILTSRD